MDLSTSNIRVQVAKSDSYQAVRCGFISQVLVGSRFIPAPGNCVGY